MIERYDAAPALPMVRLVLHWAWDPIGVRGIPEAIDEYDGYAPAVFELLQRHAPIPEIADYLIHITRDRMGLEPDQNKSLDVAALLTGLHTIQG